MIRHCLSPGYADTPARRLDVSLRRSDARPSARPSAVFRMPSPRSPSRRSRGECEAFVRRFAGADANLDGGRAARPVGTGDLRTGRSSAPSPQGGRPPQNGSPLRRNPRTGAPRLETSATAQERGQADHLRVDNASPRALLPSAVAWTIRSSATGEIGADPTASRAFTEAIRLMSGSVPWVAP